MQPLALALQALLAAALLLLLVPPARREGRLAGWVIGLPIGAAVCFQLHVLIEGASRALMPSYGVGLGLIAFTGLRFLIAGRGTGGPGDTTPRPPRALEIGVALVGLLVLAAGPRLV